MLFLLCHIRGFHLQFWTVVRTAQSVGSYLEILTQKHCQTRETPVVRANFQQLSKSCPHVVENRRLKDRKTVSCYSPHARLTKCSGKVCHFWKSLEGEHLFILCMDVRDKSRHWEITMEWAFQLNRHRIPKMWKNIYIFQLFIIWQMQIILKKMREHVQLLVISINKWEVNVSIESQ